MIVDDSYGVATDGRKVWHATLVHLN